MKEQFNERKIKINFDAHALMESQKTGIGKVADNIMKCFVEDEEISGCLNVFTLGKQKQDLEKLLKYENENIMIQKCVWYPRGIYLRTWRYIPIPYQCFFTEQSDIVQFWGYDIPPGVRGKKVVMVHDMAYKSYPDTVDISVRRILERNMKDTCKRADCIVTVSNFSKQEILNYMNVESNKIIVMPCGVDHSRYHIIEDVEKIEKIKKRYCISGQYYIYVGTLEPRKNIRVLIQAYTKLKEKKNEIPKLVLVGKKGWMYEEIFQEIRRYKLEKDIIFTGYAAEEEIPLLLNGAIAFIFPSLYEGFGIPPLEAMACGTPVIVSNRASLPEVVGNAGILVDPTDVVGIAQNMWELYNNNELRDRYREKGLVQAKKFTWESSARILKNAYQNLLKKDKE